MFARRAPTFRHVLNFLREGRLTAPPADPGERDQLIREAEFYGIPDQGLDALGDSFR
eukprot:gene39065-64640_t